MEEKQMYSPVQSAVHPYFWAIVPLELILPRDFKGFNPGEEARRQPLQSFWRTVPPAQTSLSPSPPSFCLQWILEDVWGWSDSVLQIQPEGIPLLTSPTPGSLYKGIPHYRRAVKNILSIFFPWWFWKEDQTVPSDPLEYPKMTWPGKRQFHPLAMNRRAGPLYGKTQ